MSRTPRLFVDQRLAAGLAVALDRDKAHYLTRVLRLGIGDKVRLFNGGDGEWLAAIADVGKKAVTVTLAEQLEAPGELPDIDYLFAPLKSARLDYLVQKATELGARRLRPVTTAYTVAHRFNHDRAVANVVEAAEQCNLVALPQLLPVARLEEVLAGWDPVRRLIFCDEAASITDPLAALGAVAPGPLSVLVGPEGGFSPDERDRLLALPFVVPVSLGPRIMRADTAAVAVLALVQAVLGDWCCDQQS